MMLYSIEQNTRKFKDMDFCHLEEIYLTDMENNHWILLQKQD